MAFLAVFGGWIFWAFFGGWIFLAFFGGWTFIAVDLTSFVMMRGIAGDLQTAPLQLQTRKQTMDLENKYI